MSRTLGVLPEQSEEPLAVVRGLRALVPPELWLARMARQAVRQRGAAHGGARRISVTGRAQARPAVVFAAVDLRHDGAVLGGHGAGPTGVRQPPRSSSCTAGEDQEYGSIAAAVTSVPEAAVFPALAGAARAQATTAAMTTGPRFLRSIVNLPVDICSVG